ncbi:MAG: O-antigen ligase family protein [Pyrinomonadaceae bacterium]|nr:O-antigen ligase family protein [Pyrinomonadaceae bacterium]
MPDQSKFFDYAPVTRPRDTSSKAEGIDERALQSADPSEARFADAPLDKENVFSKDRLLEKSSEPAKRISRPLHIEQEQWILKRGHTISFAGLCLFTVVLYFRPYEWSPSLAWTLHSAFWIVFGTLIVFVLTQLVLEGSLFAKTKEVTLVLLLALAALLSIPLSIDPGLAWGAFGGFLKPVLMFIILVNVVRSESRLKILILLNLSVSCVISIGAIRDYRAGDLAYGDRVAGIIGNLFDNPNVMALHLVTVVPISIALCFGTRRLALKTVYGASALLIAAASVVSFSRGGFLGLAISQAFLIWKIRKRHRVVALTLFAIGLVAFVFFLPSEYGGRLSSILNVDSDPTGSAQQRRAVLWRSISVSLRHPFLGVGIGNFSIVSLRGLGTHNSYTQVASEMGLAALAIYLAFILTPLKRLREIERAIHSASHDRQFYYLALGLQASLIGFMTASFFAHVAYDWYIYYLVGYAVCLVRIFRDNSARQTREAETSRHSPTLMSPAMEHL